MGGCGCGKNVNGALRAGNSIRPLELATYPDCQDKYEGVAQGERVWIVGIGDPAVEKLFRNTEARDAMTYSRQHGNAPIQSTRAVALCSQAVEDLVGAS